jgi:hypothetical protein
MKREQKYDDADGRRYLLIHKKIVCNGLRLVNPATSPKIAERIRSSQAMMPTSGYARNSGTRYQFQRIGSCPGIPTHVLSAISGQLATSSA